MNKPTVIWLLEDHENFAKQIMRLINAQDDMECPHHFTSADEMYDRLKAGAQHPDLLLLDLGLPRKGGLEVLTDIKTLMPNTRALILSSFDEREKVYRAICNGAAGYLLKTSDPDELVGGIREILRGESALSSPIAKMILEGFSRYGPVEQVEALTSREEDVLRYLVQGLIKKEIADELGISQHTVDMHVRSIYRKLHVRSQTEAVSKALRQGIV
ncbi:MAG TPA: response regulator transcription factor [Luteolibacter sp.]|nr:response regulator transcription factor [Luteolibacter sp.]